ncbi:MAG TPA: hypothetical protein VKX49_26280 [Bryobacteraceae bacterium]|nr:hypothetical protein [Bryobacteraceae bacterium]
MRPSDLTQPQRERLIAEFNDHPSFCRESLRVRDRIGNLVPFECWPSQMTLAKAISAQRRMGKPVRVRILKTRRSGFTLGSCSHILKEIAFWSGRRAMIIADRYDPAALEAFSYCRTFAEGYKPFTRYGASIRMKPIRAADMALFRDGDAPDSPMLSVYSADRGEIRGGGRHWALFDEVAFWRAPAETIRAAGTMVPDLPETGIIEQSTANGEGDEWHKRCLMAMDPATAEGWQFLFFGWLEDVNNCLAFDDKDDALELQRTMDEEEEQLQAMHGATLEQLHWRRWKIRTSFNGRVEDFHQEYPTTAEEAFLSSGRPALDHKALMRMPVSNGTAGELQVIEEFPRRKIRWVARAHGALTIWRKPEPGHQYVIGADPSKGKDVSEEQRGADPDFSVGFVIDQHTGEQVAMLRQRLRPVPFAEYLALLAEVYNWAFLVPEANDAGFIDAILRQNYPLAMIYNRRRDPTDRRSAQPEEIGFETTNVTRPWLVSALDDAVREMAITIRSPIALQEFRTFVIKPNGKAEHQTGCHDDCVIAAALACIGLRYAPKKRIVTVEREVDRRPMVPYGQPRRDDDD